MILRRPARRGSANGGRWGRVTRLRRPPAVPAGLSQLPRRTLAGLLVVVLAGLLVLALGLPRTRVQTGIESFLPASDRSVTELDGVGRRFGGDPIVVLLESDQARALLEQKNLLALVALEGRLSTLPDVAAVYGPGTLLNQLAGQAQDLLAELLGRRDGDANRAKEDALAAGKSPAEADQAKLRAQVQFDRRYAVLLAQGLPAGLPTLKNQQFINTVVFGASGPRPQWHFVVPSDNAVAILVRPREGADAAAVQRLVGAVRGAVDDAVRSAPLPARRVTVSGVPAVVAALSAQAGREGPLLGGVAVLAVGLCFWLVPWTRRSRRLVPLGTTLVAIGLTLGLFGLVGRPLSLGVVAFLSVVLGIGCYYPTYFAVRARVRTVLTVACATAASLGTLMLSPLPLVRDLGATLSVGVLLAALLGVLARRLIHGDGPAEPQPAGGAVAGDAAAGGGSEVGRVSARAAVAGLPGRVRAALDELPGRVRTAVAELPARLRARPGPAAVFLVALLLAGVGWAMLPRIPLETNVEGLAAGLPAVEDAQRVERVIGSSGELDVVLTGPDVTSPAAVAWQDQAEQVVVTRFGDQAHRVISLPMLVTFLGDSPTPGEIESALRLLPRYLTGSVVSLDRGTSIMVYGVPLNDLAGVQRLRDELRAALPPPPLGYHAHLSGLPVVAARGQELVSADRLRANLLGVLAAGLVLALGLRRRADALRAVLAAVLATGVGLLLLWATGTSLSPITVALGSLTAAVGCEFTVLLSEASRRRIPELRRAVLLVTATSVVGYAVLLISGIAVVREFGLLLAGAVLLALLASLCVVRLTSGPAAPPTKPHAADPLPRDSLQEAHT